LANKPGISWWIKRPVNCWSRHLPPTLSVFWIPGYPGPPATGPCHRSIFSSRKDQRPKLRRRPSWGGASWGERWCKLLRTRRPPHEPLLVRREGTPTSAQHVCMQSKKTTGRRPHTSHATPDREETNFRCACLKRHSGCWPPHLKIAWTVQGARGGRQLPPPTPVDRRRSPMKTKSTEESSLQLSTLLGRVWQPLP
jgi:hypothetical protein